MEFPKQLLKANGQALLIVILLSAIVLTLGMVTSSLSVGNLQETIIFKEGVKTYFLAESALENGLLRLLRHPQYSGESLQLEGVPCIIEVSQEPMQIRAWCDTGKVIRRLETDISFIDGQMIVSQIREVP